MGKLIRSKTFLLGALVGALMTLGAGGLIRLTVPPHKGGVVAEIQGETLTEEALRKQAAPSLIPVENDEYRVLESGVEEWLTNRLLEKEAKAQGLTQEELYRKGIWSQVHVSYEAISVHYAKTRELYPNQPFEKVSPLISQELRNQEYARVKEEFLKGLRQKYNAKVYLKKPKSFVEGLAFPSLPAFPQAGVIGQVTGPVAPLPSVPAPPTEAKSEIGTPPSRGPVAAPITLTEFSDFHCSFCKKVTPTLEELLKNYPGKVRWVFRHYPLSIHPGSDRTHEASACAQEQGKFWEFHDAVFALPGTPQEADLQTVAKNIGLDLTKFQECVQSRRYQTLVQKDVGEGSQKGVQGTPTVFVNEQVVGGAYPYQYFVNVIEGILNPGKAVAAPPAPSPAAVAPTPPAAVRFDDLKGRPDLGPENAPVTVVEFSDFYCPFCKRVTPTLEQLVKNYPGKIRRIWRHYPLSFHAGSERVHEASECAHEQGKFWPYHDKLFETQGSPHDDASLIRLAQEVGLGKKKFEKCLTSGKYKDLIQKEVSKGNQVGVSGTPTVFVNGKSVSGAQPYENFDQIVKNELAKS